MEEKQNGAEGVMVEFYSTTLEPNELKCNLCGWSKIEVNFEDYLDKQGVCRPVELWFLWLVLVLAMKWLIQWNTLHIVRALSIVQNAASTCLPFLIVAPVVLIDSGLIPENKKALKMAELNSTISELVAYHKVKRRFINLKDMES